MSEYGTPERELTDLEAANLRHWVGSEPSDVQPQAQDGDAQTREIYGKDLAVAILTLGAQMADAGSRLSGVERSITVDVPASAAHFPVPAAEDLAPYGLGYQTNDATGVDRG